MATQTQRKHPMRWISPIWFCAAAFWFIAGPWYVGVATAATGVMCFFV